MFCTITGSTKNVGNRISADSFRKSLAGHFPGNTSTHSLRKGGAKFFATADTPEQATMAQGGWRTSETMKTIYTTMSKDEVSAALRKSALIAGTEFVLKKMAKNLVNLEQDFAKMDDQEVLEFISTLNSALGKVPWQSLIDLKAGVLLKRLVRHPVETCRSQATSVLCRMRSAFAAHKALSHER